MKAFYIVDIVMQNLMTRTVTVRLVNHIEFLLCCFFQGYNFDTLEDIHHLMNGNNSKIRDTTFFKDFPSIGALEANARAWDNIQLLSQIAVSCIGDYGYK